MKYRYFARLFKVRRQNIIFVTISFSWCWNWVFFREDEIYYTDSVSVHTETWYFYGPLVSSNIKFVTASLLTAPEYFQNRWRYKFHVRYIPPPMQYSRHINIYKQKYSGIIACSMTPKLINYGQFYLWPLIYTHLSPSMFIFLHILHSLHISVWYTLYTI